jgi:hypothetical protein
LGVGAEDLDLQLETLLLGHRLFGFALQASDPWGVSAVLRRQRIDVAGEGGWIIADADDPAVNYINTLRFEPYLSFETNIVLPVDDAVPVILEALA